MLRAFTEDQLVNKLATALFAELCLQSVSALKRLKLALSLEEIENHGR